MWSLFIDQKVDIILWIRYWKSLTRCRIALTFFLIPLRDQPRGFIPKQKEVEKSEDYSIFEFRLRPTFDFQQELLWNGDALEVLEPLWLRKEIASIVNKMWNHYKDDEQ